MSERGYARPVHPRGAHPDEVRSEPEKRRAVPAQVIHTPGPFCRACKPKRCKKRGCEGHVHTIEADRDRVCDTCRCHE